MSLWDDSTPSSDNQQVRVLWEEFEKWAQSQRKHLERRRADIQYEYASRKKHHRNSDVEDEEDKMKQQRLDAATEEHTNKLLHEWHTRMQRKNLTPDAWGTRTNDEAERIAKFFTEDAIDILPVPIQNVYTQPLSAAAHKPAPPMSSAARSVNLSSSTSSSHRYVDPSSLSIDDDEGYEAEGSFSLNTDESGDEFYTPNFRGVPRKSTHASQNDSPDHLSSSGSSAYELLQPPSLSSSFLDSHVEHQKRPPDTARKGKSPARGPTYIGPYLSGSDDSSDEDDFTQFKMQTRIDKIWEFHLDAARADIELAMAIQNDRLQNRSLDAPDHAMKFSEHERRMEFLREQKEKERKELVATERQRRRQEIKQRSAFGDRREHPHVDDTYSQAEWEKQFMTGSSVQYDLQRREFVLGSSTSPSENQVAPHPESRDGAPSNASDKFGTIRARRKSQTNGTSSGWKTKHTPSPPTTAFTQAQAASTNPESRTWFSSHETAEDSFGIDPSSHTSTPVPPIPAGWGASEKPSASSLLKKVLSDPPPRKHSSLSSAAGPELDIMPSFTSNKKLPKNHKGRQFGFEQDAESPTTPTVSSHHHARAPVVEASSRDIPHSRYPHSQPEDEMSSTPRPPGFLKRQMAEYMSDLNGSTPKIQNNRLGESSRWGSNEHESPVARKGKLSDNHSQLAEDDAWDHITALADKAIQEGSQWGKPVHRHGAGASQFQQMSSDGDAWGRGRRMSAATVNQSSPHEPSLWEQQSKSRVNQTSAFTERAHTLTNFGSVPNAEDVGEEFWAAARRAQLMNGNPDADHHLPQPEPEETPWQRMTRLKAQGTSTGPASGPNANTTFDQQPVRKGMHASKPSNGDGAPGQPPGKFWAPNNGGNTSRMYQHAPPAAKQSMPGGYAFDTPQSHDRFGSAVSSSGKIKLSSSYSKQVTVEDEIDEEEANAPHGSLPYNSRYILDIAVPKPSHPPTAFSDVIEFEGEEFDEDNDYDHNLSSAVPTPSTAPTSPPGEIPSMEEEWMKKVAENVTAGKFDDMDFGSFGADISNKMSKPSSAWSSGAPAKQNPWGAQKLDAAKLESALQSVPPAVSASPPKPTAATTSTTSPDASASAPKTAPSSTPAEKATAAPEKPEPVVKTGNQNQKGKKGKGKKK
ncbi:hypothetical protein H0H93_005850 [Arthromyces matolae]|nr:hypothetical protein H0H93_005850 [Arthromyces matolae]